MRAGDWLTTNNLGVALKLEGNLTGARAMYEMAAMGGNALARDNLERMRCLSRPADGLNLSRLRLQADEGDTDAMLQLAQRATPAARACRRTLPRPSSVTAGPLMAARSGRARRFRWSSACPRAAL